MAKVMTIFVALEEMKAGRLPTERKVVVADVTARQWNGRGTSLYLKGGQEIDIDTLLHGIATVSANDAAVVLAESYAGDVSRWCAMMNDQAQRLGMTSSHFATPNGWPDGGATYVSARDLVTLAEELVTRHPELYRHYFGQKRMVFGGVEQQSHDPTVGVVRGADGIKTGHTNEAGYNFLGSAERDGRRLIMVVAGAHSETERAAASGALLEWGFAEWRERPLFAANKPVATARVQGGNARQVPLVADRAIAAVFPKGETGAIALTLNYDGPLVAPIAKGAKIAELEIRAGNAPPNRLPLFAGTSVGKAGPIDRLINGVAGLFS
jgi:D-alanyl-D-alanine carboxypeptidase (penicillin-binding protein 5/6)